LLLSNQGDVSLWRGRLSEAATFANEGLVRWREIGNDWGIAQGLGAVAAIALQQGDHRRAAELYQESLTRWVALGDRRGIAGTLAGFAGLAGSIGVPLQAARLLGAARALGAGVGVRNLAHHFEYERVVSTTRAQLAERAFGDEWSSGAALSLEQAIAEAGTVAEMVASRVTQEVRTDAWVAEASAVTAEGGETAEAPDRSNVIPLRPRARPPRRA
jgi:non-specific serine/threonine protein kinase